MNTKEIISSLKHPLVQQLYRLNREKAERVKEASCIVEGRNFITDLLKKRRAKRLLFVAGAQVPRGDIDEVIEVSRGVIEKISTVENPDNLIAEFEIPTPKSFQGLQMIIALDGLQDPGNVGTILRTALSLGWQGVFFIEPACDPFNDKALRAAKGATFELALKKGSWEELYSIAKENDMVLYAAESGGKAVDAAQKKDRLILVLGNEARGIKAPENVPLERVSIPMQALESLNVAQAAAILMYVLRP